MLKAGMKGDTHNAVATRPHEIRGPCAFAKAISRARHRGTDIAGLTVRVIIL